MTGFANRIRRTLFTTWIERRRGPPEPTPLTPWHGNDVRKLSPLSRNFGYDRGTPIDRFYLEGFLAENAGDIHGRVLEIGDNRYTLRYGADQVQRSDVLDVDVTNPNATFVGDIAQANTLPASIFDCIVVTQTLQFIYDLRAALSILHQALKPGGVLLLTAPGISQIGDSEASSWYWSLTTVSARRLLEEQFRSDAVVVGAHGNVFAATAFLYGVALEELDRVDLDVFDASYPIIVTGRAVKSKDT